jgi:hypothetical protein
VTALLFLLMAQGSTCPWMNGATAARIIGAHPAITAMPKSCEFSHDKDFLRMEIFAPADPFRSYLSRCKSSPETVKGIGNEAAVCDGAGSEQIAIGRVKEQVFVLRLNAPFSRDLLRAKVRAAADIVSGNLY